MNLLQRDMERSKRRLNEFCASMLQDADTKIAGHNNFMQKAEHKKNALRNEIDAYKNSIRAVHTSAPHRVVPKKQARNTAYTLCTSKAIDMPLFASHNAISAWCIQ